MKFLMSSGLNQYIPHLITYFIIINLIGFFVMYIDKQKARWGRWRIPEKSLLTIALLGGSIGTIAGMYTFRHKTQKIKFTLGFPTILITETIFLLYFLIKY